MEQDPDASVRKKKKLKRRILLSLLILVGIFLVLFAIASLYAYYSGSKIVQAWIIEKVKTQTKGLYTLSVKDVNLVLFPGRLRIEGLSLVPDTARYRELQKTDTLSSMLLTMNVAKIIVKDFDVLRVIQDKEVFLDKVIVESPDIRIDEYDVPASKKVPAEKHQLKLSLSLPSGLKLIDIRQVRLNNGKFLYVDHRNDTLRETRLPYVSFEADRILVDSSKSSPHLFNAEDIRIKLRGLSKKSKNGMFTVSLDEIGLSTGKKELYIKDFHVKPEYSKVAFAKKLGYQTDWMEVKAKEIRLSDINIPQLILNERFEAVRLTLSGLELEDYRDKRNPPRKNWKPPMPHEALTNLKMQLRIDSVTVNDGKITYSEQSGDRPGTLFFDKVKVEAGPLTNDSTMMVAGFTMKVRGTARLMGSGAVSLEVEFPMPAKNGNFFFSGLLTGFDMTKLNPFLSAQIPAKIESGYIDKCVIFPVFANSHHSKGKLVLYYHDLKMDLPPQTDKTWESIKKSVLSWAANTYVASSNPSNNGKLREGVVYFERDAGKSIFNYLWKSLFSGIKSTVNVNTKEQKEIKKQVKKEGKKKK
jgi:hypothetical protein